jgi:hypothetical protein
VDVVGDAVAGAGIVDSVAGRERLQVAVLIHVLVVGLQDVVVHVNHRERNLDALGPQTLELQGGHRARGVLDEDLIYFKVNVLSGDEFARRKVACE